MAARGGTRRGRLIRDYIKETVAEFGLDRILRLRHRVIAADWSSEEARWTLQTNVTDEDGNETVKSVKTRFVFSGTGYYRYDQATSRTSTVATPSKATSFTRSTGRRLRLQRQAGGHHR